MPHKVVWRTSKNMAMLFAGTGTRMVASFAFVLYSAAQLGVEGFGRFSLATHFFELFLSLGATGLGLLVTRDVARWPRQLPALLSSAILLSIAVSCAGPAAMLLLSFALGYPAPTILVIAVASLGILPGTLCVVIEGVFVAHERAEFIPLGTLVESGTRIALSVLMLQLGYHVVALMVVLVVVRWFVLVVYWLMLRRIAAPGWSLQWRRARRFALRWRVFAAENWMATVYTSLDVLVLSWISGEAAVGLYSAAWKFVRLGTVLARSYTTAVFPVMSRLFSESREAFQRLFRHTLRIMCTLALPAIVGVTVLADRLVGLLYADEFAGAAQLLRVLIWALLIEFVNPFLSHTLFAQGKQHRPLQVAAVSLVVNSLATLVLTRWYGPLGAAIGYLLGGGVAATGYLLFLITRQELLAMASMVVRLLAAAAGLGLVLVLLRDSPWLLLATSGVAAYAALLFFVQAVRREDIAVVKSLFVSRAAV